MCIKNVGRYHKIPKISPGTYIFQRPFLRGSLLEGLIYGGSLHFQIDWASLTDGSKFTIFASLYFVHEFESNFPSRISRAVYIWRGTLTEAFKH